jgi:caa(3)-type oxidase subunit IV
MDNCISINLFTIGIIMSDHDIESHIKVYWNVFYALLAFTILTVAVSYIPFEEYNLPFTPMFWALFVGLSIAAIKGYLVSAYFMHLNSERKAIYYLLLLATLFLVILMVIPMAWSASARNPNEGYAPYVQDDVERGYVDKDYYHGSDEGH